MADPDRWSRLKHHFESIRSLTGEQVHKYLDTHCADDQRMREDLLALIQSHHDPSPLPPSLNLNERVFGAISKPLYEPGDRIDQYEIRSLIGAGGMGDVYLARRTSHYEDELAIKVIRPSIATPAMLDRFKRERQTLARLDHPSITRILDGGATPDGLPYIVMEHVQGASITRFCREQRRDTRDTISLFIAACDAVQNAHQNLVIHRDIKPSNILVTDQGAVKLLDFGIAAVSEENQHKADAPSLPITLASSSPEQIRSEPVRTTTDVYSLGIVLYELLAGAPPFHIERLSRAEAAQHICQHTPPPPSAHTTHPPHARADRPRELDAIALKAIRKRPEDRYQSVAHLREDLRRYLSSQPVEAFSSSPGYRTRKLIARNRTTSALIAAAAAALLLAGAITAESLVRIRAAHAESERQRADAHETIDFLQTMLAQANPYNQDQPMSVEEAIRRADALIESKLAGRPAIAARVRLAVGKIYVSRFMYDRAEPYLADALAQFNSLSTPVDTATLADCTSLLARARSDLVWSRNIDCRGVVEMQQQVLQIRKRASAGPTRLTATALGDLALAHWAQRPDEPASDQIIQLYQQALAMYDQLGLRDQPDAAESDVGIGHAYASRGRNALAERHFRQAMATYQQTPEHNSPFFLQAANACARLLRRTGHPEKAAQLFTVSIDSSPEYLVVPTELEARWGRALSIAESAPHTDQNAALLELLARQAAMYLQDTPEDPALLESQRSIEAADPADAPNIIREVWPTMLQRQQELTRALPDHIGTFIAVSSHLFGLPWTVETLDLAGQSERLTPQTVEILASFRRMLSQPATSRDSFSDEP